jgi:hypothetical protein
MTKETYYISNMTKETYYISDKRDLLYIQRDLLTLAYLRYVKCEPVLDINRDLLSIKRTLLSIKRDLQRLAYRIMQVSKDSPPKETYYISKETY